MTQLDTNKWKITVDAGRDETGNVGVRRVRDKWLSDEIGSCSADKISPGRSRWRLRPYAAGRAVPKPDEQCPNAPQRRLQVGPPSQEGGDQSGRRFELPVSNKAPRTTPDARDRRGPASRRRRR